MDTVKFYFSFRSPYAWLALHRIVRTFDDVPVHVRRIPVFPPKEFPNDPAAVPAKVAYLKADVHRIGAAYGLPVRFPQEVDTDWIRPHAAYVYAADQGRGDAFALGLFGARFSEGRDIGADEAVRSVAAGCGLDADATARACDDPALHERVMQGMMEALQDGIFGVPFFVYGEQTFWGNDRLEWLLRAIYQRAGRRVPDLTGSLLAPPQG